MRYRVVFAKEPKPFFLSLSEIIDVNLHDPFVPPNDRMSFLKKGRDYMLGSWQSQWSAPSRAGGSSHDLLVLGLSLFAATTVFLLIQSIFSALEPRRKRRVLVAPPTPAVQNVGEKNQPDLREQNRIYIPDSSRSQRSPDTVEREASNEGRSSSSSGALSITMSEAPRPPLDSPTTPTSPKASTSNGHALPPTIAVENGESSTPSPKQVMPPPPKPVPGRTSSLRTSPNSKRASLSPPNPNVIPNRTASLASNSRSRSSPKSLSPSSSSQSPATSTLPGSQTGRKKVTLSPGHSPLDWAHLTSTTPNSELSGVPTLQKVTRAQLAYHNGRKGRPAWSSFHGKVYNIGPYLAFHPGGPGELMRGAGKAGEKLFEEIHPWVNLEGMLGPCLVGILVSEDRAEQQFDQQD